MLYEKSENISLFLQGAKEPDMSILLDALNNASLFTICLLLLSLGIMTLPVTTLLGSPLCCLTGYFNKPCMISAAEPSVLQKYNLKKE